jgi:hypothetical protein
VRPAVRSRVAAQRETIHQTIHTKPLHPALRRAYCFLRRLGPTRASYLVTAQPPPSLTLSMGSSPARTPVGFCPRLDQRRRRGRNRPAATAAPFQPHTDAANRALSMRDSVARRAKSLTRWVELRPSEDDRPRGHLLERSECRSVLRSSWAVARSARDLFGSLVDGQSRSIWASTFG